jgi:hypothetical protein
MPMVRLYHGSDLVSANYILSHGLVARAAARYNGSGEFWATTDPTTADWFARTNPASGTPARLAFEIPDHVCQQLLAQRPVVVIVYLPNDYEFLPASFDLLYRWMSNQSVTLVS